ncbi:MAG: CPBP family glutamic-type intramembrane protease [Planctomycetia bacterium]|nr:CPBP family glutamic-type intramembrane protease [Planctomycetia bacterium]
MSTYLASTRHPWPCFLFLLPLLAAYEGGVLWLGGDQSARLRNGADAWLRWAFDVFGAGHVLVAPAVVLCVMLVWSWWKWADRPEDPITAWFGMAFESVLFAIGLWQFSRNFGPIIDGLGIKFQITVQTAPVGQILTFIGAGIYEEVLFRLGLFGGLVVLLRVLRVPKVLAVLLAACAAAVAFAAAHHIGPYGEPMRADYFVFRTAAGLYFTVLFVARGFGIAVGAHAGYDVLVGVVVG